MLAVGLAEFGAPEVLNVVHVAEPCAKRGEVLIRVVAATVNPTDTLFRAGKQAHLMTALTPPYIPGMEFAGYVHQLGESSSPLTRGQPVMGIVNPRRREGGTYAQYVCAPIESVVPVSDTTDLAEAATVPMNGLTAKMAIEALEPVPGDTILVTGGAGAVGGYAIQLAKDAGLTVIADAKESDVALLQQLGADEVVPRGASMFSAVRNRRPAGVDGLIDGALLGDEAAGLVRDGGTIVSLRRTHDITDGRLRHRHVAVLDQATNTAALSWLSEVLRDGTLSPRVAIRLPMSDAVRAHRLVEQGGLRGRVVLMPDARAVSKAERARAARSGS
jgi:NADPH2:quinone reductase